MVVESLSKKLTSEASMSIAVVIPAYNESKRIEPVLRSIPRSIARHKVTVYVVDDGSRDKTHLTARKVDGVRVLRHRTNLGKGAAAKTGCDAAYNYGADIIVLMDADGQHLATDISRIVTPLLGVNNAHLVVGARSINENMPRMMRFGNVVLNFLTKRLFDIRIRDTLSGFRAFPRHVYPMVRWEAANYGMEPEMLIFAAKHYLTCVEVQIDTVYLNAYKGTTVLDGLRILKTLVKWRILWFRVYKSLGPSSA